MEKKIIAKTEASVIGGKPEVFAYYNKDESKKIAILSSKDRPQKGVVSFATIGLFEVDFGLSNEGKNLRLELVGSCDKAIEDFPNMIATAAFNFMESKKCSYGYVALNAISDYITDTDMKHFYLMNPFLWDELKSITIDETFITWLMCVPISDSELNFLEENGPDALEDEFEKNDIDVFNIYRKSIFN